MGLLQKLNGSPHCNTVTGVDDSGKQASGLILNDTRPRKHRLSMRYLAYNAGMQMEIWKGEKKIVKVNTLPLATISSAPLRDVIIYILNWKLLLRCHSNSLQKANDVLLKRRGGILLTWLGFGEGTLSALPEPLRMVVCGVDPWSRAVSPAWKVFCPLSALTSSTPCSKC